MEQLVSPSDTQEALDRIKTALARIEVAAEKVVQSPAPPQSGYETGGVSSAKVTALVNKHEAMREQVAGTMRELDSIISKLEI